MKTPNAAVATKGAAICKLATMYPIPYRSDTYPLIAKAYPDIFHVDYRNGSYAMSFYPGKHGLKIVCAALKYEDGLVVVGPRHYDLTMRRFIDKQHQNMAPVEGFIDQYGNFHDRYAALDIVRETGQSLDHKRNRSRTELYSEGLY